MMRIKFALIAAVTCLAGAAMLDGEAAPPAAATMHKQQRGVMKPGAQPGAESCEWAHDNECDEPVIGTGLCPAHTDFSDCRYLRYGETDACQYANDGECDEPNIGTGVCPMGSDRTDCGDLAGLRFRTDSCASAFDGVCDEPTIGTGRCARRTDRADCAGRERPPLIADHYFGRDDRVLMDRSQFPWSVIGEITFAAGHACTATLIAPDVLLTAAHCIVRSDAAEAAGEFVTAVGAPGGPHRARIVDHYLSPRFNRRLFDAGDAIDGLDWALLRIDQPLGARLGFVPVRDVFGAVGETAARELEIYQAGYSWDTEGHLSGNIGCHLVTLPGDGTFTHECDTTRGDSGSPFMVRSGESYEVVGVDSRFRSNPGGPSIYVAVSASSFAPAAAAFIAGRRPRAEDWKRE